VILHDVSLTLVRGRRYALLGANATGKSTLLRWLARRGIEGMPAWMRIALVDPFDPNVIIPTATDTTSTSAQTDGASDGTSSGKNAPITALQHLLGLHRARVDALRVLRDATEGAQATTTASEGEGAKMAEAEADPAAMQEALDQLEIIGAGGAEGRACAILNAVGVDPTRPMCELSGGWRARVTLAAALFVPADLLLLDNCTASLDCLARGALERILTYLLPPTTTLVFATHDLEFASALATDTILLLPPETVRDVDDCTPAADRGALEQTRGGPRLHDATWIARAGFAAPGEETESDKDDDDKNGTKNDAAGAAKKGGKKDGRRHGTGGGRGGSGHGRHHHVDEVLLRLRDITAGYVPADPDVEACNATFRPIISNASLAVTAGTVHSLVGANGAGKTTLLRVAARLMKPVRGRVDAAVRGADGGLAADEQETDLDDDAVVDDDDSTERAHVVLVGQLEDAARGQIPFVALADKRKLLRGGASPDRTPVPSATLNPVDYLHAVHPAATRTQIHRALAQFGLRGVAAEDTPCAELSSGHAARVALASAVLYDPDVVLMDEPSTHLDAAGRSLLRAFVQRHTQRHRGAVVVATHDLRMLASLDAGVPIWRVALANGTAGSATKGPVGALEAVFSSVAVLRARLDREADATVDAVMRAWGVATKGGKGGIGKSSTSTAAPGVPVAATPVVPAAAPPARPKGKKAAPAPPAVLPAPAKTPSIECRHCGAKGEHFSAQCPFKGRPPTAAAIVPISQPAPEEDDTSGQGSDAGGDAQQQQYVAPPMGAADVAATLKRGGYVDAKGDKWKVAVSKSTLRELRRRA
jgi:ATPase subunit of ABC transporter with duplicated ATPase domains